MMTIEKEAIFTLESIFNLGKAFSIARSPDEVMKLSVLSLMGKLKIKKAVGFVAEDGKFKLSYAVGVRIDKIPKINPAQIPFEFIKLDKSNLNRFGAKFKNFVKKNGFEYLIPIKWIDSNGESSILGLIFIGDGRKNFSSSEVDYINFISNFTAISLKNMSLVFELGRKVYDLSMLNEFAQDIILKKDEKEIFHSLALTLMGHFGVKDVSVAVFEGRTIKVFSFPKKEKFSKKFLMEVLKKDKAVVQFRAKDRYKNFSVAIVHRTADVEKAGILLLGTGFKNSRFENEDIGLMRTLFATSINAVESLRMLSLSYDVKLAYEIQKNLLPKKIPQSPKLDIHALTIPSKVVSGDYYDVVQLGKDKFITVIADVCGKGLPASLLMSNLQASLKSFLLFTDDVTKVVKLLNDVISNNTPPEQFITFFICKIDLKNLLLEYVNAGHNPPILVRDGEVKFLEEGGTVLGIIKDDYKSETLEIKSGDLIFLYTDGVVEAINLNGEEIGIDKIIEALRATKKLKSFEIIERIKNLIYRHSKGVEQNDDITMVAVKIK